MINPKALSSSLSKFLKKFCAVAVLASVVLLALSGYTAGTIYERYVVRLAQANAVNLAEAISNTHRAELDSALESAPLLPPQLISLDKTLRNFVKPYGIVKIKLFSTEGIVIYSTDLNIIGKNSSGNESLKKALKGESNSSIQRKGQIRDIENEDRFDVDVVESYVAMTTTEGKLVGVFEIYQDTSSFRVEIKQGVVLFVGALAVILLGVISTAFIFMRKAAKKMIKQQYQLEQMATIDSVTGLYNRAEITRRMEAEWQRYTRSDSTEKSFAVLMLDLDYFKKINDNYGHQVGDKLLQLVGHRLIGELRSYSSVGRYGGEEFVVMVPDISYAGAEQVAGRLLRLVSESEYELMGHQIKISVSIGFAVAQPDDLNLEALINRADACLYEAKNRGRACVVGAISYLEQESVG